MHRPDTAFDIGSISKTFTAAAIYRLVESGKLELDDPLEKHFRDHLIFGRLDQLE